MKNRWSTRGNVLRLLVLGLVASSPARAGDFLDVWVHDLKAASPMPTVKEGEKLRVACTWHVFLTDGHELWQAMSEQHFPVRLEVDGQPIGQEVVTLPMGTKIQKRDPGFLGAPEFSIAVQGTVEATWLAQGKGPRQVECIVNEPKQISDAHPANNRKSLHVTVLPNYEDEVHTGQPWPEAAGQDNPKKTAPSAHRKAPAGPKTQADRSGRITPRNPQRELPSKGSIRALNPQPEVPSKPSAEDKKKSKKSTGRTRPPPTP
ncbi:MAG: hypothetical protein GY937_14530 [bacterium]|nr:hypothetical protein [bacterium]